MKLLVIGAHPADPVDLAGGTMCLHADRGDEVVAATMTYGMNSHTTIKPTSGMSIVDMKCEEFKGTCNYLGCKETYLFNNSDEPLILTAENVREVAKYICQQKPDIVITHHPNEFAHWDHAECGKIVCRALKAAVKYPWVDVEKHWVPMVYFFGVQFRPESVRISGVAQAPDLLVDIGEAVDRKVKALFQYRSQGLDNITMLWDRMKSFEGEQGRPEGIRYAEAFTFYYPLKRTALEPNPPDLRFYKETK